MMLVKLSMEVVGRNILQVRGCPWGPGWCGVGRSCSSPTCSRWCTAAPSACPPSTSGTCSSPQTGTASAPGTGWNRQLPLGLRPGLLSVVQHQHTQSPLHSSGSGGCGQLQDSKSDWLQIFELLLVTSLAISLPGIGSLPGTDPTDDLHELIVGQ